jgi:WD40 repeat protein
LIDWKKVDSKEKGSLDDVKFTTKCYKDEKKARSSWIEIMVYSPNSNYLAVGSHDQNIYVMDT